MIHRRKGRKLKRTASHRNATLSNLCTALILHKKIKTTLAKAKEMRRVIDSLVTKSRKAYKIKDTKPEFVVHQKRVTRKFIKDKTAIKTLFDEIATKVGDRPGGYTRVLKLGQRLGDSAQMAIIEFVDYNLEQASPKTSATTASQKVTKSKQNKKKSKKQKEEVTEEAVKE